ncbi:DNA primase [Methanolinea mesophila]|uniref:DNA primase DnaG n=1 Tax=Methanolinea mesophila TaxID=547055 RepID=UPI001AE88B57|nr:DNA primase DnaG [Methanolinea mesophila]MBP1928043.1 DNA primase [Methanolinea mesophila]
MYSSDTTKYLIQIHIEAEGVVEKPDVVGAIFGQTEGLLGEDLDLRDLQRTGRVGRIDVQITSKKGETKGEITIASSLDRAETAILAASLESIDRVGPCVARVKVGSIQDIRVSKRKKIVDRAKELLLDYFEEGTIDSNELLEDVRESIRIEKISTVGDDRVPAGPNVLESDAIIVVEGRADVINLLRFGIKNAVAVEGTNISQTIIDLCEKKTSTAFLDGDRGGELILRELLQVADMDFVAFSPRGKSVEDMSRKEIIKALRNKIPAEYVREQYSEGEEPGEEKTREEVAPAAGKEEPPEKIEKRKGPRKMESTDSAPAPRTLNEHLIAVKGKHVARFLTGDFTILKEGKPEDIEKILAEVNGNATGLILDGNVNQRLLDMLVGKGLEYVAARDYKGIIKRPLSIRLMKIA